MSIDKKTVEHMAHLSRIELNSQELDKLSIQLEHILGFIDKLKQADIKDVIPTSHVLSISNVLREDTPRQSLSISKVLKNAPEVKGNSFSVPKIIE